MKCDWCGRFIAYDDKDAITYTHYGSYLDTEPPEDTRVCGDCWNKCKRKEYYIKSKYIWRHATKLIGWK